MSAAGRSRPHLLLVAWVFPPSRESGVRRVLAIANLARRTGFDVTVLTAEEGAYARSTGADASLLDAIDAGIEVVRLPFSWPVRDHDLSRWPRERALRPGQWVAEHLAHETDAFPEPTFGTWLDPLSDAAEEVHARHPVDLVLACPTPNVVTAVADHLARHHGTPYVVDQRNSWSLDLHKGLETGAEDARVADLEGRYLAGAGEVWFPHHAVRDWYADRYPGHADRMRVVPHGHDPTTVPPVPEAATGPLRFTVVGTIGPGAPVAELLEGWVTARRTVPALADATLDVHGYLEDVRDPAATLLVDAAGDGVRYHGPARHADVVDLYAGTDVLVLVAAASPFLAGSRVAEYVATGLPIAAVHAPGAGVSDVLAGYPLRFPAADLGVHAVAAALAAAGEAARSAESATREAARAHAAGHDLLAHLAGPVADLHRVLDGGSR